MIPEFKGTRFEIKNMKVLYTLLLSGRVNLDTLQNNWKKWKKDPEKFPLSQTVPVPGLHYGPWTLSELTNELRENHPAGWCRTKTCFLPHTEESTAILLEKMMAQRPEIVEESVFRSYCWYEEYSISKTYQV